VPASESPLAGHEQKMAVCTLSAADLGVRRRALRASTAQVALGTHLGANQPFRESICIKLRLEFRNQLVKASAQQSATNHAFASPPENKLQKNMHEQRHGMQNGSAWKRSLITRKEQLHLPAQYRRHH